MGNLTSHPEAVALAGDVLADRIRAEVEAAERDWQSALGHAIRAGELLLEAKAACKHGEWLPWLEANELGERNARNYMRLAANRQTSAVLEASSIEAALKLLSGPSKWARHSELAPLRNFDLAPPRPMRCGLFEAHGARAEGGGEGWDHAWSCSSR